MKSSTRHLNAGLSMAANQNLFGETIKWCPLTATARGAELSGASFEDLARGSFPIGSRLGGLGRAVKCLLRFLSKACQATRTCLEVSLSLDACRKGIFLEGISRIRISRIFWRLHRVFIMADVAAGPMAVFDEEMGRRRSPWKSVRPFLGTR